MYLLYVRTYPCVCAYVNKYVRTYVRTRTCVSARAPGLHGILQGCELPWVLCAFFSRYVRILLTYVLVNVLQKNTKDKAQSLVMFITWRMESLFADGSFCWVMILPSAAAQLRTYTPEPARRGTGGCTPPPKYVLPPRLQMHMPNLLNSFLIHIPAQ